MSRILAPGLPWLPALALLLWGGSPLAAQSSAGRSVLDGVYTVVQAERGDTTFRRSCATCHLLSDFTAPIFLRQWSGLPVAELFDLVSATMPQDVPGSLRAQQYADVLAHLFHRNGLPPGERELPAELEPLREILIQPPPR